MSGDKENVKIMTGVPPIFYAAAQVKFNPVLRMDAFVGAIQNEWRVAYPDFSTQVVNELQVQVLNQAETPQIRTSTVTRWSFKDGIGKTGYLLSNDTLVLQTTHYTDSKRFVKDLIEGLKTLHKIVSLSYIEGVGFRTLDVIMPTLDKPLSVLLNPKLIGLLDEVDGELSQSIYQLTKKRDFGNLITRTIILNSRVGIPADLAPINLSFREDVSALNGMHAILDNDVIQTDRFDYDPEEAIRRLQILKAGLNDAFYKSLTSDAVEPWS